LLSVEIYSQYESVLPFCVYANGKLFEGSVNLNILLSGVLVFFFLCGCDKGVPVEDSKNPCGRSIPCTSYDLSNAPPGKIVFSAVTEYGIRDSVYNNYYDQQQLFMVNPDGTELQQITDFKLEVYELTLSPDGSRIAFTSWGPEGTGVNTQYIYVYGRSDSSLFRLSDFPLGEPQGLTWSPDGKRIAYYFCVNCEGFGTNDEIFVIDVETKQIARLTDTLAADSRPTWSPHGTQIAFYSNRDDPITRQGELYIIDIETGALSRLTCTPESEGIPSWSPDGCHLAFSYQSKLQIIDLREPSAKNAVSSFGIFGGQIRWSPDAKELAQLDGFSLYVLSADGTGRRLVHQFPQGVSAYRSLQWVAVP